MVEAAAAFVERFAWVAGMLDQSHAQSARVHDVDPRQARGLVEPVTPDLEAEYPGVPPRACMAVGDRQVKVGQPGKRRHGCHQPILPQPAIGDAFALKAARTLGDSLLTGINPQEGKGRPSTRQRTV
jgi:hypothetical protein